MAKREPYEAPQIGAMMERMFRALVRRAEAGDTEALEQILRLQDVAADSARSAGRGLVAFGYSYGELARWTGVSRQAAAKRYAAAEVAQ